MKKFINKNQKKVADLSVRFHRKIHSHSFRQAALLSLIVIALFFDLLVLGWGQEFSKQIKKQKNSVNPAIERDVQAIVKNSPMERMTPYISREKKEVAAFLVSIAKKESNLGKYSPRMNGKDCYNYWGYRAQGGTLTASGYSCFDTPQQAVNVVSSRIERLVYNSNLKTPEEMIVWKCGWDCSWDNPQSVNKWISDVDYYFQKFYD